MKGTWDRTRTLRHRAVRSRVLRERRHGPGHGQLLLDHGPQGQAGRRAGQPYGNIWGRKFYKTCGDMPSSVPVTVRRRQGVPGQRPGLGRVGRRRQQLEGRHHEEPLADRSSRPRSRRGTTRSTSVIRSSIVRCAVRRVKASASSTSSATRCPISASRGTTRSPTSGSRCYGLLDGTIGHHINNQGEGWGLLDFSSNYFDQGSKYGRDGEAGRLRLARWWGRGRRRRRVLRHPRTEQLQHRETARTPSFAR